MDQDDLPDSVGTSHAEEAAEFIAEAEWYASLKLPVLPDDPAASRAMRAAGYDVLAEVRELDGPVALVSVAGEDEEITHAVAARTVAEALGIGTGNLTGAWFLAVMRETPEDGPALSGFRPALPGGKRQRSTGSGGRAGCLTLICSVQQRAADEVGHGQARPAGGLLDAAALALIDAG